MPGRSIIEQVQEEKAQGIRDEARRPQLRQQLEFWRSRGYIVARLAKAVEGDVRAAESVFNDFERDVRRLSEVQLRLNSIDAAGFPGEAAAIRQKLNDPDAAGEVESNLEELAAKVKARKAEEQKRAAEQARKDKELRMGLYRQRIAAWAEKGYATRRLDGLLEDSESDSVSIENALADFDQDIHRLLELRKKLEPVREMAGAEELGALEKLLFDPDALEEAGARIDELSRRFYQKKSEHEKRQELQNRCEEYRLKGYRVGRLEGVAGKPLAEAEELLRSYEADVGSLFKLWDRLRALNRSHFAEDWEAARAMMNDPDRVTEVEKAVAALEARQQQLDARRAEEDQRLVLEARKYIAAVYAKMKGGAPDYLPLGFYIREARWEPHLSPDGMFAKGEVRSGLFTKETGVVAAGLVQGISRQALLSEAEAARSALQYVAHCLVMTRAAPELVQLVKGFQHANLSAYIYDMAAGALVYNEEDVKTRAFADWFVPGAAPAGLRGAVRMVSDKHGIFTRAVLGEKLGLQRKEVDEMLRGWLASNEVIQVSKIRDEYSFME